LNFEPDFGQVHQGSGSNFGSGLNCSITGWAWMGEAQERKDQQSQSFMCIVLATEAYEITPYNVPQNPQLRRTKYAKVRNCGGCAPTHLADCCLLVTLICVISIP